MLYLTYQNALLHAKQKPNLQSGMTKPQDLEGQIVFKVIDNNAFTKIIFNNIEG